MLFASMIAAMALTGCSSQGDGSDYQPPSAVGRMTFRWTAEPGISLVDGPAVAVRAYLESYDRALFAQDERAAYQGFNRAVRPNAGDYLSPAGLRRPVTNFLAMKAPTSVGTEHLHIQRITQSSGQTEAIVFSDVRRISLMFDNDWRGDPPYRSLVNSVSGTVQPYGSMEPEFPVRMGITVMRILMSGSPEPAQPAQHGSSNFPRGDVFGNWSIDEFSVYVGQYSVHFDGESFTSTVPWATADADLEACKHFAQPLAEPQTDGNSPLYPTEPSDPGWPER